MSNYTKATNFAIKDGLTTGDPAKKIKGTEIDDEFNAISSAIASKIDGDSPTLTGTPLAPTAAAGTNTTQIATTAFVNNERSATATLSNKTLASPTVTGSGVIFEGSTANDYETTLTVVDPTADRTVTLPDASFTVAGLDTTQTLTNKTIALGSNTVSGTKSEFNTAVTDTDFAFLNDFTGSNQSLATSGYQKLPGGLVIQWGQVSSTADGQQTFSFSTSFATACLFISLVRWEKTSGTADEGGASQVNASRYTTSGFTVNRDTGFDGTYTFKYLAIGY